jgi:hypothetical protein
VHGRDGESAAQHWLAGNLGSDLDAVVPPVAEDPVEEKPKTFELTLTVTGTADGEWRAELKQGTTYRARNLAVAAAAVSRAAKELHEDHLRPDRRADRGGALPSRPPARRSPIWSELRGCVLDAVGRARGADGRQ